jgi:putative hydrolase of the HAD superfamily
VKPHERSRAVGRSRNKDRVPVLACLIDVYETVLTVDFASVHERLAGIAGVPVEAFRAAADAVGPEVTCGTLTMAEATARALRACRVNPDPALVRELVAADRQLLIDSARIHDDTIAFLEMLSTRGVRSAFVSNCAENTRPLLSHLGLDVLVDAVILSCEVGCAKPSAQIYLRALEALGVAPHAALLVDDQSQYCEGAGALGIVTARIVREPGTLAAADPETTIVRSLADLDGYFPPA